MGHEYTAEIGHKLGWDLAHYGWEPKEDAEVDVIEGHKAGKAHFGSRRKTPDRFERKWLQLRQSAIRRGRVVDESVAPEFIASIDHPICPVTLVEMTHSTRQDTDWSVDRVNNEGAYSDGNLVVMSVRANRAKGSKTYQAVESILSGQSEDLSLGKEEWARLRCIMLGACNAKSGEEFTIPLLTRIPNRCTRPSYFQLQHIALLMAASDADTRNAAIRSLNACHHDKGAKEHLKQAVRRLKTVMNAVNYKYDACMDESFQKLLRSWESALPKDHRPGYKLILQSMAGGAGLSPKTVRSWSLDSGGYYVS